VSMTFGDQEKEKFRRLLFEEEKRCSYQVWDYVVMGNHYHALIHIPEADAIPRAEVLRRWQEAEVAVNQPAPNRSERRNTGDASTEDSRYQLYCG
jgi:REP element-mobilizing transposase RayT